MPCLGQSRLATVNGGEKVGAACRAGCLTVLGRSPGSASGASACLCRGSPVVASTIPRYGPVRCPPWRENAEAAAWAGWIHEIKYDGYRTLIIINGGKVTRGRDFEL